MNTLFNITLATTAFSLVLFIASTLFNLITTHIIIKRLDEKAREEDGRCF